jgi:predicted amidohydrolase YtcJ
MPAKIDDLLPTAKEIQRQAALEKAGKADEQARNQAAAQTEKQKLIEKLTKPSGLSEDEKVKLASRVIQRAVRNGLTEVQVYRFPNSLCTDKGRAINQMEAGWEKTLTGMAKEIYQLWADHLQPRGYRIRYQVIDYSGGIPGDIGITVSWGD